MRRLKIAAIVLVMSAGVVGSYLIVSRAAPAINFGKDLALTNATSSLDSMPIKWLEKVGDFVKEQEVLFNPDASNSEQKTESDLPQQNTTNLTQIVAQSLFGQMKNLDQAGDNPFSADSFDPNNSENQKLLAETISNLQNKKNIFEKKVENS